MTVDEGFFYEEWGGGERMDAGEECARIPAAFLAEERETMGDRWFRQEYCCEFVEAEGSLFDEELIRKAIRDDLKPLDFRRW